MPAVLVHGVPETAAVWHRVVAALARPDVLTPQLPGFRSPRPAGFDATKEAYVDWLIDQVERASVDGPVDLVGHDWGGALVVRLVSLRPELVRSWVTDCAGMAASAFEWHDYAKIWQTPGAGEAFFQRQLVGVPEDMAPVYEALGVPADDALRLVTWTDELMADSILRLYRSAIDVGAEWSPAFVDITAPGLAIIVPDDPFLSTRQATEGALRSGARLVELDGVGHWWMLQDPLRGAAVLEEFWASLDREPSGAS
jgi:pimeloyl-ACP methyl ester carboxylesterase